MHWMMRKYFLLVSALMLTGLLKAQDPHFSRNFSPPRLPSTLHFTGKFDGSWRLAANHRDQWPSIPKAYVTTSASVDFPILKKDPSRGCFRHWYFGCFWCQRQQRSETELRITFAFIPQSPWWRRVPYYRAGFQGNYSSMVLDIASSLLKTCSPRMALPEPLRMC